METQPEGGRRLLELGAGFPVGSLIELQAPLRPHLWAVCALLALRTPAAHQEKPITSKLSTQPGR